MTTYYVDPAGSDSNAGTATGAAWKTIAKVAATSVNPGDSVLFKRGATWYEQLNIPQSGTAGSPVTYGAYGSGALPVIHGGTPVTGWALYAPGTVASPNLIANPGFETWAAGVPSSWSNVSTAPGSISLDSVNHTGGTASLKLTSPLSGQIAGVTQSVASLVGGADYTLSFYHMEGASPVGQFMTYSIQISINGGAYANMYLQTNGTWGTANPNFLPATATTFTQVTKTFTMPVNANISLVFKRSTGNTTINIDDVSLTKLTAAVAPNTYRAALSTQALMATLNNNLIRLGSDQYSLTDQRFFWTGGFLYLKRDAGNPDDLGDVVEAGQRPHAIFGSSKNYITVQNLQIEKTNARGIRFSAGSAAPAAGAIVEDCTVRLCTYEGVDPIAVAQTGEAGAISFSYYDDSTARRNTVTEVVSDGIYYFNSLRPVIQDNTITTCYGDFSDNIQVDAYSATVNVAVYATVSGNYCSQEFMDGPKGNIILFGDHNIASGNFCQYGNFGVSIAGSHCQVTSNKFYKCGTKDTFGAALYVGDTDPEAVGVATGFDDNEWSYNTAFACRRGAIVYGTGTARYRTNQRFYHNTLYASTDYGFQSAADVLTGEFKNNVVYAPGGHLTNALRVPATTSWTSDYNLIGPEASGYIFFTGSSYSTLAAYSSAKSKDSHSKAADPLLNFDIAATGRVTYRVRHASPVINAGTLITGFTQTYRGTLPDMGSIEGSAVRLRRGATGGVQIGGTEP